MGLDCYLYRKAYISHDEYKDGEFIQPSVTIKYNKRIDNHNNGRTFKPTYIIEEIGYWRKANHIHSYFVDKFANGIDECQIINVGYQDLVDLKGICQDIITKSKTDTNWGDFANSVLPTRKGFFFGGIEYDEWYLQDCQHLIDIVDMLDKDKYANMDDFYYQASW